MTWKRSARICSKVWRNITSIHAKAAQSVGDCENNYGENVQEREDISLGPHFGSAGYGRGLVRTAGFGERWE